jgi:hypothetical protein
MQPLELRALPVTLGLLFLTNCSASSTGTPFPANFPGPAVPSSFARMFDGQCFSNKIFILAAPFSPAPTPVGAIAQPCGNSLAFNLSNGALAAASSSIFGAGSISIYNPPYSSASAPTATLSFGGPALSDLRQIAWDGSGNIWVADAVANKVYQLQPPFTASSAPTAANTLATQPAGLAINPYAGLMFIGDLGGSKTCAATPCHLYVVPAPYTGVATATFTYGTSSPACIAVDRLGRLFVGFDNGPFKGLIKVYLPPFVTDEEAAYTLTVGNPIESLAFDSGQNLYAQLFDTGGVVVFNGPILGSIAVPSAVLGCPAGAICGAKNWAGLGFGP